MGRLTSIDRPSPWSDTTIGYSYSGGSLTQTFTRGTEQDSTTFDAMLRPTQSVRQALSGGGGSIYTSTTYDAMGRPIFASLPSATAGSSVGITTDYDALGRVTRKRETATGGSTHNFTYPAGNKTTDTDQELLATTSTSSGFGSPGDGNVTSIAAPEGVSVTKSYDIYGNIMGMSQAKGDGTFVNTTFTYDSKLRLCRKTLPETGGVLYAYNAADELTSYAEGQPSSTGCAAPPTSSAVVLTYDPVGRLWTTNYPNSTPDISRTYDGNGNLLTLNRGGINWTYTYNTANLIDVETLSLDALNYRVFNTYDSDERVTQKIFPSGRTYTYTNDGLGRIKSIQGNGTTYVSGVTWHPNGKIKQLTQGNGNVFDQQLNTRQLTSFLGSTFGDDFNYSYDPNGRITTIDAVANYAYDRTLTYDGVGRLKTAGGPWGAGSFTYDALGNLKNKTLGSRVVDISYDSLNHVSQVRDTAVSSSWRAYTYDTRGNVMADGIHTFTHDDSNQPTSITGAGAGTYAYDGNLRRVKTVAGGATTYSFYDKAGNVLGRNNRTTNKKTDYLSVGGQTFVRVSGSGPAYPINDHLGTALWVASPTVGRTGIRRHVEDATNLTYMQARYYDPVLGRFLEIDPIGYDGGLNLYAYVGNDPVDRTDPAGLEGAEIIQDHDIRAFLDGKMSQAEFQERAAARGVGAMAGLATLVVARTGGRAAGPISNGYRAWHFELRLDETRKQLDGWKETPNKKGVGSRFQDPNNAGNRVRVDKGNPDHSLPSQRVDHVVEQKNGRIVNRDGEPIEPTAEQPQPSKTEQAHVPWTDWINKLK